jgi:hypothetical protein
MRARQGQDQVVEAEEVTQLVEIMEGEAEVGVQEPLVA